ncbi:MAG TPA: TonB-dependent receptor, partial [Polyangiaceae bacterium]|nr:TonB-dependent receptor [Polyangiaceae bacterium]
PLDDVAISATSPSAQGEQLVVTDAAGAFRLPNLPPGAYALRFERAGYRPYALNDVQLRSGATLRTDVQLLPETLSADEVTVVAGQPTVDVGSTRSGVTLTADFTSRVPVAPATGKGGAVRSFEQLADVAPTSQPDLYGASIAGTTSVENQYLIDGLSVGDPGFGYNGTPLSIDFIKETNIVTGGYLPEYGRGGGGVLEVVTKSGGDEFHGSVFANFTPWQAQPKLPVEQDAIRVFSRVRSIGDIGFDLGGPIVPERLWFYVGADVSYAAYDLTRDSMGLFTGDDGKYLYDANGLIRSGRILGTRQRFIADQTQLQYVAKLTYSPSADDRLELAHRGTPSRGGGDGHYALNYETGAPPATLNGSYENTAVRRVFEAFDTSLKWLHTLENKRVTFDTTIGWHHQRSADLAIDGSDIGSESGLAGTPRFTYRRSNPVERSITEFETLPDPEVCTNPVDAGDPICPVPNYTIGGPGLLQDRSFDRAQLRHVTTAVFDALGQHIIKAGLELEALGYDSTKGYPGGPLYRESISAATVSDLRRFGGMTAPDEAYTLRALRYSTRSLSYGAFLQDSWSILNRVTLNVGARYDAQYLFADQGLAIALPNQWSPRIGVIFDPTRRGAAKLFGNFATYYQTFPLNIVDRAGSGEPQVVAVRSLGNCDPGSTQYPASCDEPANLRLSGAPQAPSQRWSYSSVGRLAIDPDLRPQSTSELSLGGEYELFRDARIGVTYLRRWMNDVVEDLSRDEGSTFFLGNPGRGIASDFPRARRNYDAGILSLTKTFSELWLAQASYTLAYLRGNWEGLYRPQTGQLDPGSNSDFDLQSLTVNRYGPLAGDRRHELKLFLAREVVLAPQHHLNVGGSYRARSGGPRSYLGSHVLYGLDEVFILPRGAGQRLPWQHSVDAHLGYTFLQTEQRTVALSLDAFNLFDFSAIVSRSQRYTTRDVEPITGAAADNPFVNGNRREIDPARIVPADGDARPFEDSDRFRAYGAPTAYQEPLTLRLSLKATF